MSANLASETNFYIDFEPITFCQLIKKTLYYDSVTESVRIYAKRPYTAFCGRTGTYLVPIFPKSP